MGTQNAGAGRPSTIIDIAREAGTSISTVSYVINNGPKPVSTEIRRKVQRVIRKHGYSPDRIARSLKRRRSMSIGVIFPEMTNIYFPETLGGILEVTQHESYNVILRNASGDSAFEEECVRDLISSRVDGLLIRPTDGSRVSRLLRESGIPFIVVDRRTRAWHGCSAVSIDHFRAMQIAVGILTAEGHRRITLITGPEDGETGMERSRGFLQTLSDGSVRDDGDEQPEALVLRGSFSQEHGRASMAAILDAHPEVEAVITGSTRITLGALEALRERGKRVPDDMALVAYGYRRWLSLHHPPITCIEQPVREMGRRAARLLLAAIGQRPTGEQTAYESVDPVLVDGLTHTNPLKGVSQ